MYKCDAKAGTRGEEAYELHTKGQFVNMIAEADLNEKGRVVMTIICENRVDERIMMAMANSPWVGSAIKETFRKWQCPFYEALAPIVNFATNQVDIDTIKLRKRLHVQTYSRFDKEV